MRLASRILWFPIAILAVSFILLGAIITWQVTSNSNVVKQRDMEGLISIHKKELNTAIMLVTSSSLPADAFIGLEGDDDELANDLMAQVDHLDLDQVLITDLSGNVLYPPDTKASAGLAASISRASRSQGSIVSKYMDSKMVTSAPIIDVETPKGFLVFILNIDPKLSKAAASVFRDGGTNTGASAGAKRMRASRHMVLMADELAEASSQFEAKILSTIGFILLLSLLLVATVMGTSSASIINRVKESADRIRDVAEGEGDLTKRVTESGSDEGNDLSLWFNKFIGSLQQIVASVKSSVDVLSSSTAQITHTAKDISMKVTLQASQTEQAATSITEMSQTILDVARNSADASSAAKQSVNEALEGNNIVDETVSGMLSIADTVRTSAETISKLGENSRQIGEIVSVINDIADQTNLLALNAAIEAARAGDQGRGFAVVADEVRKLAERTGRATEEIADMVKKIQMDTKISVESMENGVIMVQDGVSLAEKAKSSLQRIVSASEKCVDMVNMIASSTEEQSAAIEEVSNSMEGIATASRESKTGMDQIEEATSNLSKLALKLKNNVDVFKV